MAKPIQNDPDNAREVFTGRLGPSTRFTVEITGPLDAVCMGRLIEALKLQQATFAGASQAAGAK